MRERFGEALLGVVFYGSALRDEKPDEDGLFDLYAVVSGYRAAGSGRISSLTNALLPPNVYYLETPRPAPAADREPEADEPESAAAPKADPAPAPKWRCKFNLVTLRQLDSFTAAGSLQPYFWGRLSQPVEILWSRDEAGREAIAKCLAQARRTMLSRIIGLMPSGSFSVSELWARGLEHSYRTEFRAEKKRGRAQSIATGALEHYAEVTAEHAAALGLSSAEDQGIQNSEPTDPRWTSGRGAASRFATRSAWFLRRIQGRVLQIARLVKATWTFDGGLDYLLWKIERHSGVRVEPSPLSRRHPVLFGWLTLWKARREGGFR